MKKLTIFIMAVMVAQPAIAADVNYSCAVDEPQAVNLVDGSFVTKPITLKGLSAPDWTFQMAISSGKLTISWPKSPLQLNGSASLINTGEDTFAAFLRSKGPCLFTGGACGASVQFATQSDGSLVLQIQPLAVQRFPDGHHEPFVNFIKGRCTRQKAAE